MKSGRIRAIGIDLGTTNSAVSEIVWDPAVGASTASPETARVPGLQIRTLEIEQPTREGVYTSTLVPSACKCQGHLPPSVNDKDFSYPRGKDIERGQANTT